MYFESEMYNNADKFAAYEEGRSENRQESVDAN